MWRSLWETRKWVARCCLCSLVVSRLSDSTQLVTRAEMATFISVPLKKSSEVDLVKPLSKFVTATYAGSEDQAEYLRSVDELNKLRKNALGRPLDKHESSLEVLLRYTPPLPSILPHTWTGQRAADPRSNSHLWRGASLVIAAPRCLSL